MEKSKVVKIQKKNKRENERSFDYFPQLLKRYFKYLPALTIVLALCLFSPALSNFFSGDDWFHLNISEITTIKEFFNFFSFSHTPQSAAFYRPLPTQVFFFVFHSLFGLSPFPYYLFVLIVFGFSLYLIYLLAKEILKDETLARLSLFFYAVSATNFTRLYFLSAFQEIAMTTFVLLSLIFYLKKPSFKNTLFSLSFFILALLSKETAVVLPSLLLLIDWLQGKLNIKRLIPFVIILGLYLYGRLWVFGSISGESYIWDLSLRKAANTFFWYTLWSFGTPELLVDYVSSGLRILPRFFSDFPDWSYTILFLIFTTLASFVYTALKNIAKIDRRFFFALAIFVLGLLPVSFLPWHKFTLELSLPMVGFSMMLARLSWRKKGLSIFVLLFFFLNVSTIRMTQKTHYSVNRSIIARRVFRYFQANYPIYPWGKYFEFINDTYVGVEEWGSSKQIAHTISQSNMFKVMYNNKTIEVFYEDFGGERPKDKKKIEISSKIFLPR